MSFDPQNQSLYVSCFLDQCDANLNILAQENGFAFILGRVTFINGRKIIRPVKASQVEQNTLLICRMEHKEIAIEITFCMTEFSLETYVYYGFVHRFTFNDIMTLNKEKRCGSLTKNAVQSTTELEKNLQDLYVHLCKSIDIFKNYEQKDLEKALRMRSKIIEQTVREHHKNNMDRIIKKAAKAFRDKDYKKVIEIFKPYENILKGSNLKKYERAKSYLTQ